MARCGRARCLPGSDPEVIDERSVIVDRLRSHAGGGRLDVVDGQLRHERLRLAQERPARE